MNVDIFKDARSKLTSNIITNMRVFILSGRVLDSRLKGHGFETHRRHCAVVLEHGTFILA